MEGAVPGARSMLHIRFYKYRKGSGCLYMGPWGSVVLSRQLTHNMWSHTQSPVHRQAKH